MHVQSVKGDAINTQEHDVLMWWTPVQQEIKVKLLSMFQGVGSVPDAEHGVEDKGRDAGGFRALHM